MVAFIAGAEFIAFEYQAKLPVLAPVSRLHRIRWLKNMVAAVHRN